MTPVGSAACELTSCPFRSYTCQEKDVVPFRAQVEHAVRRVGVHAHRLLVGCPAFHRGYVVVFQPDAFRFAYHQFAVEQERDVRTCGRSRVASPELVFGCDGAGLPVGEVGVVHRCQVAPFAVQLRLQGLPGAQAAVVGVCVPAHVLPGHASPVHVRFGLHRPVRRVFVIGQLRVFPVGLPVVPRLEALGDDPPGLVVEPPHGVLRHRALSTRQPASLPEPSYA